MKILISPSVFGAPDSAPVDKLIKNGFEIVRNPYRRKLTRDELLGLLPGIGGLIAGLEILDREVLEQAELKVISRCGAGVSNIDLKAAGELGIKIFSTPDAPTQAVAELTLGAMLSMLRLVPQMDCGMHQGEWNKKIGTQLAHKAVAIIGFGRIGQRIAELLSPFMVKILAVDPFLKKPVRKFRMLTIEEALAQADIISIHSSGDGLLLGEKEFAMMKCGVFLLNAARGSLVSESALLKALDDGTVAGAWLDCFSAEPYKGPLAKYPQVILTPHVGSYTAECRRAMEMEAVENLIKGLRETGTGGRQI